MNTYKHNRKRVIASTFIFLVLVLIMALGLAQAALADTPPGVPQQFYGTVTNNGGMVGAGYTVSAQVGGASVASTTTDAQGTYGVSSVFYVPSSQGSTINFSVDGVMVGQTAIFFSGSTTRLDLTVTGAPPPGTTSGSTILSTVTASLPGGTVDSAYSATLQASGGTVPYTWSISSGSLPAGLTLNTGSGVISGTPTATETASFTVQVNDSASHVATQSLSIQTNAAPASSAVSSPPAFPSFPSSSSVSSSSTVTIPLNILGTAKSIQVGSGGMLVSPALVTSDDGKVQFNFAAHTITNIQGQSLTVTAETSPPAPPSDAKLVSAYDFSPNGSTFSPDISLTLKYDAASLPEGVTESNLQIAFWNGTAWSDLPSTVDTQNQTVSTQVSHFTIFAILGSIGTGQAAAPAGFSISTSTTGQTGSTGLGNRSTSATRQTGSTGPGNRSTSATGQTGSTGNGNLLIVALVVGVIILIIIVAVIMRNAARRRYY